ncbi:MAG TPA: hypothetical protein VFG51_03290 [Candidatus Saccharimonadia bacterium]|nr:hypothetical protein [Candidatus Saccharimonadia bacterium]
MDYSAPSGGTERKKEWKDLSKGGKAAAIIVLLIFAVIIISGISAISGSSPSPSQSNSNPSPSTNKTNNSSTTKPHTEPKSNLAKQVETAYLKQVGYGSIAELNLDRDGVVGSPENEISMFDDESSGVVKISVQDSLTKSQAKLIGASVMVDASDVKSLKWVDVRGTNGTYAEVSRQDAGLVD